MSLQLWKKKMAIIAAINKGYLLDVSGNPAVLTNALKKPLQGVTVYGASGGVGGSGLPSGYTRLEYIEGTGTQYIDTGVVLDQDSTIELDAALSASYPVGIAGSRTSATENNFTLYQSNSVEATADFCDYTLNRIRLQHTDGERVRIKVSKTAIELNDTIYPITSYSSFTTPGNCYLFYYSGNVVANYGCAQMDCYGFRIWQGTELVRDLIPAKRDSDDTVGMYDVVNGAFYGNAGTGDFVAGREIYKIPVLVGEPNVPGYTRLEYIEGTGTQYIDTGVVPTDTQAFDITYAWTALPASGAYAAVFSNYASEQHNVSRILQYGKDTTYACTNARAGGGGVTFSEERTINTVYHDTVYKTNNFTYYVSNGTVAQRAATVGNSNANSICIFARLGGGLPSKIKLYAFTIADNDTLVRNFIPAKRNSDNAIGMYDTVTGTFYTNSGTGDFVAGAAIANKTINLYTPQQLTAAADTFAADIAAQTATLTAGGVSTDVSALQDWDQDFELTKGDNSVSVGTTVQPSAVDWRYLSYSRGE